MATTIANTAFPPIPAFGVKAVVCAVLTKDDTGKYAAYIGIVPQVALSEHADLSDEQSNLNWFWAVAGSGRKLNMSEALDYFNGLDETNYRR